ncbi:MAG: GTPase Era [Alphaproteobacteria bacterium]|nr:GTPase Era [Alphaproteobacteria bacterium]
MNDPVVPPIDPPIAAPATPTRYGTVAILGAPNAGKSTLVNALVGAKVSIVTPKVQTTRSRITGISVVGETQIVFHDTPGIFAAKRPLDAAMVDAAWAGMTDADAVLVVVDSRRRAGTEGDDTARIVGGLQSARRKAILVLNKVDLAKKPVLLTLAQELSQASRSQVPLGSPGGQAPGAASPFTDIFMISALHGSGVDDLRKHVVAKMPPGPWHYPEDQIADANIRFLAAEITREKLFLALHDELPYALTVETENWQERGPKKGVRIDQRIFVLRESHKPIILGTGGSLLKDIGTKARLEISELIGQPAHLFLQVSVRPNWTDEPARWREMGLEFRKN